MPEVQLNLSAPSSQLVEVRITLAPRHGPFLLSLPSWTPGSYLIRDYVRHLERLRVCRGGRELLLERLTPAQWRVLDGGAIPPSPASAAPGGSADAAAAVAAAVADSADDAGVGAAAAFRADGSAPPVPPQEPARADESITITYAILAAELTVRTCHLNNAHGFLALAAVVLQVEGERWSPHRLELLLPPGWQPFVPLPSLPEGGWIAADYDQLIDTPVEAGPHVCHPFSVAGVPHRWVTWGEDLPGQDRRWLDDVTAVCLQCCRLMGAAAPAAERYLFILHLIDQGYGGLEHHDSSVLLYGRQALATAEGRRKLLQLVAHEYLHQWNVRRLRPAQLTPIDYDRPCVIPTLWFAEGVTSYVDQMLPLAAGLGREQELLEDLGSDLSRYLLTPGRRIQSLRQSSEEAWVKLYRQDAHSADNQVSYYLKGAVLALVLDLHLRRHGSWLGAVIQQLWSCFGRQGRGYGEADLIAAFASHAPDLSTLLPLWLQSTEDPPLEDYLADLGLRMVAESSQSWFTGLQVEIGEAGSLRLRRVERHSPAQLGGLEVGDELIALDGQRLSSVEALTTLTQVAGSEPPLLQLLIARHRRVEQRQLRVTAPRPQRWTLEIDPAAAADCEARRSRWARLQP
ncbi:MAG: PDZ domain-containing protein [Cyanobium sp.]